LLQQELGVARPVRTVGAYLPRWGYTAQRPRRHAQPHDPEDIRHGLADTDPARAQRAAHEEAESHGCDETGVGADEHPAGG
jgi:hypothetical protein